MLYPGMRRHVYLARADVLEEGAPAIVRVERIGVLGILAVTSIRFNYDLVLTVNIDTRSFILF
jgi:hypothetical protein